MARRRLLMYVRHPPESRLPNRVSRFVRAHTDSARFPFRTMYVAPTTSFPWSLRAAVCTGLDSCPSVQGEDGQMLDPLSCSKDAFEPTEEELEQDDGKVVSCECGGDPQSEQYCAMQPFSYAMVHMSKPKRGGMGSGGLARDAGDGSFQMTLKQLAGQPDVPTNERYRYAYPIVWNATFTGCRFSTGDCYGPIEDDECDVVHCDNGQVSCPPDDVPKCPDWDPIGDCGPVPNATTKENYWQFHCIPLATPVNSSATMYCAKNNASAPYTHCYFYQKDSLFGQGIGMKCKSGNCMYKERAPRPSPLPPSGDGGYKVPALVATNFFFAVIIGLFIASTGLFIHKETQKWRTDDVAFGNGAPSSGLTNAHSVSPGLLNLTSSIQFYGMPKRSVSLQWSIDSYVISRADGSKRILDNVCGEAYGNSEDVPENEGGLFAILGPSGAGKTTLLDILAGRQTAGAVSGDVRVNGRKVTPLMMTQLAGYAPQSDILPGTSTVWEYLLFHANLRLPPGVTPAEKKRRVTTIVAELGLTKVMQSFIGDEYTRGISGGEKKCVSVAAELLHNPCIMFLDEPTTGLDSTNAATMVELLASLGKQGVIVVLSIHQPRSDIFQLMERVLVLSSYGQMVYSGHTSKLSGFLSSLPYVPSLPDKVNIADFLLDLVIKSRHEIVASLIKDYKEKHQMACLSDGTAHASWIDSPNGDDFLSNAKQMASFSVQVKMLSIRFLRNMYRHPFLVFLNLVCTFAVSILIGVSYWKVENDSSGIQNRMGCLFFILIYLALMSLSSIPIWRDQHVLFLRESAGRAYGASAYFVSVILFDILPMRVFPPCFFGFFTYWMVGLHRDCTFCLAFFLTVLILSNIASALLSMAIGAASPSNRVANFVGSLTILVLSLFGSFLMNKGNLPAACEWISDVSFLQYAYEALVVNEFHNQKALFTLKVPIDSLPPLSVNGDGVLKQFGFDVQGKSADLAMLFVMAIVHGLIGYAFLNLSGKKIMQRWTKRLKIRMRLSQGKEPNQVESEFSQALLNISAGDEEYPSNGSRRCSDFNSGAFSSTDTTPCRLSSISDGPSSEEATPLITPLKPDRIHFDIPAHQNSCISWCNVSKTVFTGAAFSKGHRTILHNVFGLAGIPNDDNNAHLGSSLFAILGPSGAGKTTLLDILAGRQTAGAVSGDVRVNGRKVTPLMMTQLAGYAPQSDILPGTSTVWEYLLFHANLRLPPGVTPAEKKRRVTTIVAELGLTKVMQSFIGDEYTRGISGGEKKCVSVAAELLHNPCIMFLDEPTTGLDSTNAATMVELLASLGKQGVIVVLSIQQPRSDIFQLMERVLVLSSQGQMVYSGPLSHLSAFMQQTPGLPLSKPEDNMADYILDVIIKESDHVVSGMVSQYQSSMIYQDEISLLREVCDQLDAAPSILRHRDYVSGFGRQVMLLSQRLIKNSIRQPFLLYLNFVSTATIALMLGFVFYATGVGFSGIQNRMGSMFFIVLYLGLASLSSVPVWNEHKLLFLRERQSYMYSTLAHFTSVVLFDIIPMRIVPTCMFTVSYFMIGLSSTTNAFLHFPAFVLILVLTNAAAVSMAMAIGACFTDTKIANAFASLGVLLTIMYSGFILSRHTMSGFAKTLTKLSYMSFAFEALLLNEFHHAEGYYFSSYADSKLRVDVTGDEILALFDFQPNNFFYDATALVVMSSSFFFLCYLLLLRTR